MNLTRFSIHRPVGISMIVAFFVVLGLYSYYRIGVELLPALNTPYVTVTVKYPGANAESIEQQVIKPIEDALSSVSDIKKRLYEASQQLLFEQNTDLLWINFKSLVTPLLETMVSNNILSEYKLTKYNIDPDSGEPVPAYKVLANIRIKPVNSVEVFELSVMLENNDVAVEEVQ